MEVFRIAAAALSRHKMRSFLTLLGVIIGVATVVSVISIISGLNNYISEKVFQLNPDVYVVTQFGIITNQDEFLKAVRRKRISMADLRAVERGCTRCTMVGAQLQAQYPVRSGSNRMGGAQIFGNTANMGELRNLDLEEGRFFTRTEEVHSAAVAVIGSDIRTNLFGRLDPIGQMITINGVPLRVIGLLREQGSVLGQSQDNQAILPLSTFRKRFGTGRSLDIFVKAEGGVPGIGPSEDEVRVILRGLRRTPFRADDPFGVVTAESLQKVWNNISAGAFALMMFISGISLVVGGIVIMNIMLVSVIERTREIGIRRALGARRGDILRQFLTEAVLLSLAGGAVGVLLGILISKAVSTAFPLPTLVRPEHIVLALSIAVLTGLSAGVVPAKRAARLAPVEALRWE